MRFGHEPCGSRLRFSLLPPGTEDTQQIINELKIKWSNITQRNETSARWELVEDL